MPYDSGRARDREMMLNPDRWPAWPYLPLKQYKRPSGLPETSVLVDACVLRAETPPSDDVMILRDVNLFALPTDAVVDVVNVDTLLDDGWIVD